MLTAKIYALVNRNIYLQMPLRKVNVLFECKQALGSALSVRPDDGAVPWSAPADEADLRASRFRFEPWSDELPAPTLVERRHLSSFARQ